MSTGRRVQQLGLTGLLLMALLSALACTALAGAADVEIRREAGFVRLVLRADELPAGKVETRSTIVVAEFKAPLEINLSTIALKLPDYISIARRDPDGRGFRLAMTQAFKVNSMRAGNRLVIDIMGTGWSGAPPGMPQDIIDELAKEAAAAKQAAEELARRDVIEMRPLQLEVFHANHPTFSRIQFSWNRYVSAEFTRSGDKVEISFNGVAKPALASLTVDPPNGLVDIRQQVVDQRLQIIMTIGSGIGVRAFREGNKYVVDLTLPEPAKLSDIEKRLYAAAGKPLPSAPENEQIELAAEEQGTPPRRGGAPPLPRRPPTRAQRISPDRPVASQQEIRDAEEALAPNAVKEPREQAVQPAAPEKTASDQQPDAAGTNDRQEPTSPQPAGGNSETRQVPAAEPVARQAEIASQPAATADGTIQVVRSDNSVQIRFPFNKESIPAAIFQRGRKLWILIDDERPVDVEAIQSQLEGIVSSLKRSQTERGQMFEFLLSGPWLSSVSKRDVNWNISIGDLVTGVSDDIPVNRQANDKGQAEVFVPLLSAGRLHFVRDAETGDNLAVVTALAPTRHVRKFREYVDFQLFNTIHGVTARPIADDVTIELKPEGVHIGRSGGLRLSRATNALQQIPPAGASGASAAQSASTAESVANGSNRGRGLLRNIEFKDDTDGSMKAFVEKTLRLERQALSVQGRLHKDDLMQLARHWLTHGFGPESVGVLELLRSEQAEVEEDPVFRLMSGIAQVLMQRPKMALRSLDAGDLEDNPHASLWRAIAAYQMQNFERARLELKRGAPAIEDYIPEQQAEFRLAAADSALRQGEVDEAGNELDKIPEVGTTTLQQATARFLEGRILEQQNRSQEAMRMYSDVVTLDLQPVAARAVYHLVDLRLRLGEIKASEGVEALERLSIVWRGDETELMVLNRLADLYVEEGRYDDAFNLMETAVKAYPEARLALALQDRMKQQFRDLFLNGKADNVPPIKALALFYDHKELTPPGRLGDEMIRLLTDRLVAVDLLDKASELLEHQISRRLKGAGRAQVAIRLAMIQLMQHQPKKALDTLYKSSQTNLPVQVKQARKILEARAFADLGRSGPVLELLADDTSDESEQIKSLALWNGQKWGAAGEQYEKALKDRWRTAGELTGEERNQVLRSAIAYTLGGDTLGAQRIRDKFGAKMANGTDAAAFALITDPLQAKGEVIEKMVRDIADIDTLEAFIKAFRQRFDKTGGPQSTSSF